MLENYFIKLYSNQPLCILWHIIVTHDSYNLHIAKQLRQYVYVEYNVLMAKISNISLKTPRSI